jgi:hypothetical protein
VGKRDVRHVRILFRLFEGAGVQNVVEGVEFAEAGLDGDLYDVRVFEGSDGAKG